ncbi:ALG6, ALG8 glycosyltransferase family protein [Toxoplasma gondii GT1]|uniref:dolichyl-P-Glc:Man9GlcNAc2-PP-dolichol alpha-1,3-glucosyltransferase n=2 Tax=Toxoplasma gondii TaxID=5811 RepID=S7W6K5_TOXGG|nr:ALG6, ALG8 glycosyltransferase family protein [Toxoplasma gondii GT1]KAF4641072.1 ALG6, ALG8 glycosyltransferase family protein [Toxoplasma gondii]
MVHSFIGEAPTSPSLHCASNVHGSERVFASMRRRDRAQRRPSDENGEALRRDSSHPSRVPPSPFSPPLSTLCPLSSPLFFVPLSRLPQRNSPSCGSASRSLLSAALSAAASHPRTGIFLSRCLTELQQLRMHTRPFSSLSSFSSSFSSSSPSFSSENGDRVAETAFLPLESRQREDLLSHLFLAVPAGLENLLASQPRAEGEANAFQDDEGDAATPRALKESWKRKKTDEPQAPRQQSCRICGGFALQVYVHLNGLLGASQREAGKDAGDAFSWRSTGGRRNEELFVSDEARREEEQRNESQTGSQESKGKDDADGRTDAQHHFFLHFTLEVYADYPFEIPCLFFRRLVSLSELRGLSLLPKPRPSSPPRHAASRSSSSSRSPSSVSLRECDFCSSTGPSTSPRPRLLRPRVLVEEMQKRLAAVGRDDPSEVLSLSVLGESWLPSLSLLLLLRRLCAFLLLLSLQLREEGGDSIPQAAERRDARGGQPVVADCVRFSDRPKQEENSPAEDARRSKRRKRGRTSDRRERDAGQDFWLCRAMRSLRRTGKAGTCLLLLFVLLLRAAVGLHPYSGEGRMQGGYGDFEAQRHWMEIAFNLPLAFWYTYGTYLSSSSSPSSSLSSSSAASTGRRGGGELSESPEVKTRFREAGKRQGIAAGLPTRRTLWWPLDYPPLSAFLARLLAPLAFLVHPPAVTWWTWRRHAALSVESEKREKGTAGKGGGEPANDGEGCEGAGEEEAPDGEETKARSENEGEEDADGDAREDAEGKEEGLEEEEEATEDVRQERGRTTKKTREAKKRGTTEEQRERQRDRTDASSTRDEASPFPQFRGIEESLFRVFMRWTVIVSNFLVFALASLFFFLSSSETEKKEDEQEQGEGTPRYRRERDEEDEPEEEENGGDRDVRIGGCAEKVGVAAWFSSRFPTFSMGNFFFSSLAHDRSPRCPCASRETQSTLALLLFLLSPPLLLIDDGHFQYNGVALGLTVAATAFLFRQQDFLCAFCFTLALLFKQTSLYFAPAFFAVLLSRATQRIHFRGALQAPRTSRLPLSDCLSRLFPLGLVVLSTCFFSLLPFVLHPPRVLTLQQQQSDSLAVPPSAFFQEANAAESLDSGGSGQSLPLAAALTLWQRVFPFHRGLFEDYVSNFWVAVTPVLRLRGDALLSGRSLLLLSLALTLAALLPACVGVYVHPTRDRFLAALFASASAFFLFSFHVHEKAILLPATAALLLLPRNPDFGCTYSLMATFSLLHLMQKDVLVFPATLLLLAFFYLSSLLTPHLRRPACRFKFQNSSVSSPFSQAVFFFSTKLSRGKFSPSPLSAPHYPLPVSSASSTVSSSSSPRSLLQQADAFSLSRFLSDVCPALLQLPVFPLRRVYIHLRFAFRSMCASLFPSSFVASVSPATRPSQLRTSAPSYVPSALSRKREELEALRASEAAAYVHVAGVLTRSGAERSFRGLDAGRCMPRRTSPLSGLSLLFLSPSGWLVAAAVLASFQLFARPPARFPFLFVYLNCVLHFVFFFASLVYVTLCSFAAQPKRGDESLLEATREDIYQEDFPFPLSENPDQGPSEVDCSRELHTQVELSVPGE